MISDWSGRKGGLTVAIILLAIGVILQMIVIGSSPQVVVLLYLQSQQLTQSAS